MSQQIVFNKLLLSRQLWVVQSLLRDSKTEEAAEVIQGLEYKTENLDDGVLEKINEIKLLTNSCQFTEVELLVNQLLLFLKHKIFSYRCNKTWNSLVSTEAKHVRFCQTCFRNVYEIKNEEQLNFHLAAKNCIYYLGEANTIESCHINQTGDEGGYNFRGLMGTPNIVGDYEDDGLPL